MTQDTIKIDHMAEAEKILEDLEPHRGQNLELDSQLAQAHATLELARQQRLANLIAMHQGTFPDAVLNPHEWLAAQHEIADAYAKREA